MNSRPTTLDGLVEFGVRGGGGGAIKISNILATKYFGWKLHGICRKIKIRIFSYVFGVYIAGFTYSVTFPIRGIKQSYPSVTALISDKSTLAQVLSTSITGTHDRFTMSDVYSQNF